MEMCIWPPARDIEVFAGGEIVARYPNKEWPSALGEDAEGVVAAVGGELYQVRTNFYRPYPYRAGGQPAHELCV